MQLGRLMTAMITPFDDQERIDHAETARLAQWLVRQGNQGLIVAGTTGEGSTLDPQERLELFATVKAAVRDEAAVIAGTGGNDTRVSVLLTQSAAALGVDGILAVVPYYNKPTQEGMLRHFSAIAESTDLPIIVYNIPSRTGVNMTPVTLLTLAARYANIIGVKESSGNFSQFSEILRDRKPGFQFWVGDDYLFAPSLAIGGDGLISVAGHLCAREFREILDAHDRGDVLQVARLHQALTKLFAGLFETTNPLPIKWAMNKMGFRVGIPRSPLVELPQSFHSQVEQLVEPYLTRV